MRQIKLTDITGLVPLYFLVTVGDNEQEWDIQGVELYSRSDRSAESLIGDDFFQSMPISSKGAIYAMLDTAEHAARQKARDLVMALHNKTVAV